MTIASTTRAEGPSDDRVGDDAPLVVLSADTHVGPRLKEELRPYCPKKYLEAYDEFLASPGAQASVAREMWEQSFSDEYRNGQKWNLNTAGHYDPVARLRDMDWDGVAGGVVFHNSLNHEPLPFDAMKGLMEIPPEKRELAGVGRQMYNRWLVDFCSVEPARHVGLAYLPLWDVDASVEELEWCAEHGLGGVNFPAPGQPGLVPADSPESEKLYAACAALDMTLTTHIGTVAPRVYSRWDNRTPTSLHFGLLDAGDWGLRTVSTLVVFGMFERHPNLKLVITEVPGVHWNELAVGMDSLHSSPIRRSEHNLPRLPSEYMATNVWMGNSFQSRQEATTAIEIGRADRFCWGSDYPHPEGTFYYSEDPEHDYPMTRVSLANTYHDLPLDKVRMLVGENLLEAYPRFDADVLYEVAERIGMTVGEISNEPDLSQYPFISETASLGFRTIGPWS